ncbi:MAG TPA: hypothetical protein VGK08_04565 [Thermoanaerobaculia bacterium]
MKTTVEIPDELLREWKKRAAERGTTLKEMWVLLLRDSLHPPSKRSPSKRKIRWVTGKGGLPAGLDVSNRERMYDWLRGQR